MLVANALHDPTPRHLSLSFVVKPNLKSKGTCAIRELKLLDDHITFAMSYDIAHFTPSSPFFSSSSYAGRLATLRNHPTPTRAYSSVFRRSSHFTEDFIRHFDQIDVLGGSQFDGSTVGHTGCVK